MKVPRPSKGALRRFHRWFAIAGFLVLITVVGIFGYKVYQGFSPSSGENGGGTGEVRTVQVLEGLTAGDVAELLEREGIIDSSWTFVARLRMQGAGGEIKPGTYEFRVGEAADEIIAALREGGTAVNLARVTLPEGLSMDQAADRLREAELVDADNYVELAKSPDAFELPAPAGMAIEPESLEGLLFPETYLLPDEGDAETLIAEQLKTFSQKTAELPWENASELGVSPYQVVIIASLIEKEARIPEERAKVSAVIYNRLEEGMTLGIDATVRYAVKKWTGPLTRSDLAVDSPYNTRVETGLPPGPIASPGLAALEAALQPEEVDYLYYVLQDEAGHHFFTASYDEFLQAKENAP